MLTRLLAAAVVGASLIALPGVAEAQQRSIINPGFEDNNPGGPGVAAFEVLADSDVPGWISTTAEIELWDSGFLGVTAQSGNVLAEMNANNPGALYQEVCFTNGETIGWSFAHRARAGGL